MATSYAPVLLQLFDDTGEMLAGGFVYTYEAGTDTPLVTYQDLAGATPNENPVELDAAGRANIRLTNGVAYKYIVKTSAGATVETQDNVIVGIADDDVDNDYEVVFSYIGTPGAQGWMGGLEAKRAATFPVDLEGSGGSVITNPGSDFAMSLQKNGVAVATITISSAGAFTFATVGGTTFAVADGDTLDLYAPDSVGTAANFKITLVGAL